MTWLQRHSESEKLAAAADLAAKIGPGTKASRLYLQAAEAELLAIGDLDPSKVRTLGISIVSAASLFYKAGELASAERVACQWLTSPHLPPFASQDLRTMLQSIWSEQTRERARARFVPGEVLVSIKGGEIIEGGAPLDLILEKVHTVQSLFYRSVEHIMNRPLRRHGGPEKEIQNFCRPWLFQAAAGSYQFAVAVQEWGQLLIPTVQETRPAPTAVAGHFLKVLRASVESQGKELEKIVPEPGYRATFLKLARNLAPNGKSSEQVEVHALSETRPITLVPDTRKAVTGFIQEARRVLQDEKGEETLHGILRAVHLEQDWIMVVVGDKAEKITEVGEALDDVIGPMVNKPVAVTVQRTSNGAVRFRDMVMDD